MNTKRPEDPIEAPRPFLVDLPVRCPDCRLALWNDGDGALVHKSTPGSCRLAGERFAVPTIELQKIEV